MAKRPFQKALSVGLSLTLCAALIVPSFAASFTDLQNAIDGGKRYTGIKDDKVTAETEENLKSAGDLKAAAGEDGYKDGTAFKSGDQTRFGYAWNAETQWFGIEAWNGERNVLDEQGEKTEETEKTRHVQLNENVVHKTEDEYIRIGRDGNYAKDVELDLNGKEICVNEGLTIKDGELADSEGNPVDEYNSLWASISVTKNGVLTIQDSSEEQSGKITGNAVDADGKGGVAINNKGTLIMESGSISGNQGNGVYNGGTLIMTGGEISENGMSGVYNAGALNMTGGEMNGNQGKADIVCAFYETNISEEADVGRVRLEAKRPEGELNNVKCPVLTIERELEENEIRSANWVEGVANSVVPDEGEPIPNDPSDDPSGNPEDAPASRYQIVKTPLFAVVSEEDGVWSYTVKRVYGEVESSAMSVRDGDALELPEVTMKDNSNGEPVTPVGVECVKWESSDPSVAYVDGNGNWVCLRSGTVTLTATYTDKTTVDNGIRAAFEMKFTVTVNVPSVSTPVADNETEIDDVAVPLAAGPVTRAQFIDYLWRHEGEPASSGVCSFSDVPADHEFILALAWAEETGIAEAYLDAEGHVDGTFEPDELVTVAAVREFLGNYAEVFELNVDVYELATLIGEDDEAVLNCDEVIEEFFDLVEALEAQAA